tara:strand:- start:105 stop:338 length:234 start_codon:yes stop_codon:yes gene_type:complete
LTDFTDSKNATHHWYPFLKYQEECEAAGKEATVNDWMRTSGQLQNRIDFEVSKEKAEAEALKAKNEAPKKEAPKKES